MAGGGGVLWRPRPPGRDALLQENSVKRRNNRIMKLSGCLQHPGTAKDQRCSHRGPRPDVFHGSRKSISAWAAKEQASSIHAQPPAANPSRHIYAIQILFKPSPGFLLPSQNFQAVMESLFDRAVVKIIIARLIN